MWTMFFSGAPFISLAAATDVSADAADPADATASISLENDGDIVQTVNGVTTDTGDWIVPKASMGNYDVKATLLSGSLSGGTTGSNLNLGTTRSWTRSQTVVGNSSAVIRLDITFTGTTTPVLATKTIALDAEVT